MKARYMIAAAAALAALVSCNKEPGIESVGEQIQFTTGIGTRAQITSDNLTSSEFKIIDVLQVNGANFIDDILTYNNGWTTKNQAAYYWTPGDHLFISWLDDENFAGTLNSDNQLVITKTVAGGDDVDFIYADAVAITQTEAAPNKEPASPVQLQFHHLFSGVMVKVTNNLAKSATLNSLAISGTEITKTATISFGSTTSYAYSNTATGDLAWSEAANQAIAASQFVEYEAMVWEQEIAENGATFEVSYTVEGASDPTTASVALPAVTWEPGKRYVYNLTITSKDIELTLKVIDWNDVTEDITYGTQPIANAVALEYASGHGNTSGSRRTSNWFASDSAPIVAYFSVFAPSNGTWKITVTGNTSKFIITGPDGSTVSPTGGTDANDGTVTLTGSVNGRVEFQIARNGATASDSIELNFSVLTTGENAREISLNSEVTRGSALTISGKVGN